MGDARLHPHSRRTSNNHGFNYSFHLWFMVLQPIPQRRSLIFFFQVYVFRFGLRYSFPSVVDGGPLQELLQHVRKSRSLPHCFLGSLVRRRTTDGTRRPYPLPGMGRREPASTFPVPNASDDYISDHADRGFVVDEVGLRDGKACTRVRHFPLRGQHSGGYTEGWRAS